MSDDTVMTVDEAMNPQPKPPRLARTRWQLVRWHLRCALLHALGRLR